MDKKYIDEDFITDTTFFNQDFYIQIEKNNYPFIIEKVKEKHQYEILIDKDLIDKKHDLIIWNSILARNLIKDKILKTTLHDIYNNFYKQILKCSTLIELHQLELCIFNKYMKELIYNLEVTTNHTVNAMLRYIHMNLENYFSLANMSNYLQMSDSYLSSLFKKEMNISIMEYVHQAKIDRAKILLKTTYQSIINISQLLGYCDSSHFSKTFKSIAGVSPLKYRNTI